MGEKTNNTPSQRQQEKREKIAPRTLSQVRVVSVGASLIGVGMIGFYTIPGLIDPDAGGNPIVNAFYCSVMTLTTVGFGDICPGNYSDPLGDLFLLLLPLSGLGFFCGPILSMASSWQSRVPGGILSLGSVTLAMGVSMLTVFEGMALKDAIHLSIITGTTIGYGNVTPSSDLGRFSLALYAILVCNVAAAILDQGRIYLESFCHDVPLSHTKSKVEGKQE